MKNLIKTFIFIACISITGIIQANNFSANDLVTLTLKDQEQLTQVLNSKGYNFDSTEEHGLSKNDIYKNNSGMTFSVIEPTFNSDGKMLVWEFVDSHKTYNALQQDLGANGFKKSHMETRQKYVSSTYTKPGVTIILSCDKSLNNQGVYQVSVRYTNAAWYNLK
ncbi:MAG: hypothetical protein RL662_2448 [Bacteroidota bacterium]|jgi:hypothetical protein